MGWGVSPIAALLVILASGLPGAAQVTIQNPKNLPVDQERVALLYRMSCQEVAESFHIRDYAKLQYPLNVVLGEERERYEIDHKTGTGTIYIQRWEEVRFAGAAAMLAIDHVMSTEQFRAVVTKTLKRFRNTRPVTVSEAGQRS